MIDRKATATLQRCRRSAQVLRRIADSLEPAAAGELRGYAAALDDTARDALELIQRLDAEDGTDIGMIEESA